MIGQPFSWARTWDLFRDPTTTEKRQLLSERWEGLDPAVRLPGPGLGQKATGCAEANRIPALPTDAILAQLDELRAWLGPKINVQITDGEVTLLPVQELTRILRYARSIGIVPMVMTHGDNFRRQPGLLDRLVEEGGLTEVSIHVDITQRGRDGYPVPKSEEELMPLRDEFAAMIREVRRRTGRPLRAAMTLTVSRQNLPHIAGVVRWLIRNRDAFSLVSFQPLAQVGRTRKGLEGVTADELWGEIGNATSDFGLTIQGTGPMHFGHPECTRFVPLLVLERQEELRLVQFIRDRPEDVAIMQEFFERGLGGVAFRDDLPLEALARGAGLIRRAPGWFLGPVRRWVATRVREEAGTSPCGLLLDIVRGKLRMDGFTLTSHHFMSPAELQTEVGKERLAACVFRLPYKGEMVPMCRMNAAGVREQFYSEISH